MDAFAGREEYVLPCCQLPPHADRIPVSFIDETNKTRSWYSYASGSNSPVLSESSNPTPPSFIPPPAPVAHPSAHRSNSFSSIHSHGLPSHRHLSLTSPQEPIENDFLSPNSDRSNGILHSPLCGVDIAQAVQDPISDGIHEPQVSHLHLPLPPDSRFTELGKLSDCEEAYLLHHYTVSRARLLDVCDPHNHFGRLAPELATRSRLLLSAILAVSAHHLSRTAGYDPLVAERYHEACVELLIPMLDDLTNITDEVIAATVLLRNFEQMSSAITGFDSERHLSGTSAFMNSERTCIAAGGLRQASFWIFIRQDLDIALSQQRPLKLNLKKYAFEMDLDTPSDDWGWANKIVWITAEVVAFTFGWEKSRRTYEDLKLKTEEWWQRKPASFRPLYVGRGPAFPAIYYSQPWHALGMQYYHITMILLAIGDPGCLKIGFGHNESRRLLQQDIAYHAGLLFGICVTVDDIEAKIAACNAISVCAAWLTDRAQQETLIAMLARVEREVAWPTRSIAAGAMQEWSFSEEDTRRFDSQFSTISTGNST
jgi:hypothetical protein